MRRLLIAALLVAMGLTAIQAASGAIFNGTPGSDRLSGTARADELYGRGGNDILRGRGARDLLDGGTGRDGLFGGAGADWLITSGDGRADTVQCGGGRDIVNADLADVVRPDCEVVSRQVSRDLDRESEAQHETQVEPDSHSFGNTIVTVFQSGRFLDGGAANIGFATSRNGGITWRSGLLPGLSFFSTPPGSSFAVSDPVVVYDVAHRWWLVASLDQDGLVVSRSRDGLTWAICMVLSPRPATEGADSPGFTGP